jgi:ribonuclease VapC
VPLDSGQAEIAFDAWRRYGKGRHPAGLNLAIAPHTPLPPRSIGRSFLMATTS